MKKYFITSYLILLLGGSAVIAHEQATPKQCAKWQKQLVTVENKLRELHTNKQGNKLRAKHRELRSRLYRHCR